MKRLLFILVICGFLVSPFHGQVPNLAPSQLDRFFNAAQQTVNALEQENKVNAEKDAATNVDSFAFPGLGRGPGGSTNLVVDASLRSQNAFSQPSAEARRRRKLADVNLEAAKLIASSLGIPRDSLYVVLPQVDVRGSSIVANCPFNNPPFCREDRYRTIDGTCNNINNPYNGAALAPQKRLRAADYANGADEPRVAQDGNPLPNARRVSVEVHRTSRATNERITGLAFQWGQFLDHDITLTPISTDFLTNPLKCCDPDSSTFNDRECNPIVFSNDPEYGDCDNCMNFVRSIQSPRLDCALGAREQLNQITAYIDASNVYGSEEDDAEELRERRGGRLRTSPARKPGGKPLLPTNPDDSMCNLPAGTEHCFKAGDERSNEQSGLATMHTIWLREHNRVAQILEDINPTLRDETLYQEARRIVAAEMQHITYNEWLPIVLGRNLVYNSPRVSFNLLLEPTGFSFGYDQNVDATIANEFSTAAFRFGHTLIPPDLMRVTDGGNSPLPLRDTFFRPTTLYDTDTVGGVDPIAVGLSRQIGEAADANLVDEVRDRLFSSRPRERLDLAALNIQRGRDHGIPGYNTYREHCGLSRGRRIDDFRNEMDNEQINRLKSVYRHADDVDLFAGGLSERTVDGGLVGPTFSCIIGKQFDELRRGDRFWYENAGFSSSFSRNQLEEIRKVTLARILCDNGDDIREIQPDVFRPPTRQQSIVSSILFRNTGGRQTFPGPQNSLVSCGTLPAVNIHNYWRGIR